MTAGRIAVDTGHLNMLLKSRGLHMARFKYQRPEVYLWAGKSGTKFWKAEWRIYIEGRPPKHRAATWPCSQFSKAKAQEEADRLIREETSGPVRPDGSMSVADFWTKVFYPIRKAQDSAQHPTVLRVHMANAC